MIAMNDAIKIFMRDCGRLLGVSTVRLMHFRPPFADRILKRGGDKRFAAAMSFFESGLMLTNLSLKRNAELNANFCHWGINFGVSSSIVMMEIAQSNACILQK